MSTRLVTSLATAVVAAVALTAGGALADTMPGGKPVIKDGTWRSSWTVLRPVDRSGVHGMVGVRQNGATLIVSLTVTGLKPGSKHAAHVHGPSGTCSKRTTQHAAELGNLTADRQGVARKTLRLKVSEQVAGEKGYYVMVHENPGMPGGHMGGNMPENPPLSCGNL